MKVQHDVSMRWFSLNIYKLLAFEVILYLDRACIALSDFQQSRLFPEQRTMITYSQEFIAQHDMANFHAN